MVTGCLLGYGRIGKIHYKNIIENNLFNLKYIHDLEENLPLIQSLDSMVKLTSSFEEILTDKEISIGIVCTPTKSHYSMIIQLLNHGKHVFCEKPISNTEKEIKDCYNLAASKNLVLLCGFNRRFDPEIMHLKTSLQYIGKIYQITTISRDYPYPKFDYLKISSGIFTDCAVHDIDYVNWFLNDKPISVSVTGSVILPYNVGAGELDTCIIIMEYSNGTKANINLSRISNNYDQRAEIYGIKGKLSLNNPYHDNDRSFPISFAQRYNDSYINELLHFLDVIQNETKIKVSLDDCINCLRIVEACEEAFQDSTKVKVRYDN